MFEVASLLEPIKDDTPAGLDLRNPHGRPELYDVRGALRNARQQSEGTDGNGAAAWAHVEELCIRILSRQSKDLEIAAILAEAATHSDGIAGLAASGQVIEGLIERYWDALFPLPDEDDSDPEPEEAGLRPLQYLDDHFDEQRRLKPESRRTLVKIRPLVNLLEGERPRLSPPVHRSILFTLPDGTSFNLAQCAAAKAMTSDNLARKLAALPEHERQAFKESAAGRLWTDIIKDVTADPYYADARQLVSVALAAWRNVAALVVEKAGGLPFSGVPILNLLSEIDAVMPAVATAPSPADSPAHTHQQAVTISALPPHPEPVTKVAAGPPASRDEALHRLEEIAEYFRKNEPFSPIAYILEEAIRRSKLSWPEWLSEAVPDMQQRKLIRERLGMRSDVD